MLRNQCRSRLPMPPEKTPQMTLFATTWSSCFQEVVNLREILCPRNFPVEVRATHQVRHRHLRQQRSRKRQRLSLRRRSNPILISTWHAIQCRLRITEPVLHAKSTLRRQEITHRTLRWSRGSKLMSRNCERTWIHSAACRLIRLKKLS